MKEPVVIKSYQLNGLKLVMEPSVPFEDILRCLEERLKKSRKFFKDIPKGLMFEGRELSFEEQEKILDCIREHSDIHIVCIMEEDEEIQKRINEKIQESCLELEKRKKEAGLDEGKEKELPDGDRRGKKAAKQMSKQMMAEDPGLFYKGNLRSGQVLESDKSIILLGDVKPGANVISGGNIIVLGSLRGNAFAGSDGRKNAFIVALDMQPVQIRIDDFIARSPDEPEKEKDRQAKIAFLEGENIYIEPVCREVFNDIRI